MDFNVLNNILKDGTIEELEKFCLENDLIIEDGKILHKNHNTVSKEVEYWDKRQLIKKINLNS